MGSGRKLEHLSNGRTCKFHKNNSEDRTLASGIEAAAPLAVLLCRTAHNKCKSKPPLYHTCNVTTPDRNVEDRKEMGAGKQKLVQAVFIPLLNINGVQTQHPLALKLLGKL